MSQKEESFQSKPRRGGQKFGGRGEGRRGGGGKSFDRPRGRSFGERNEGDRPRSFDRGDRPFRRDREEGAGVNPYKKRKFGGSKEGRGGFGDKPRRDFGDRPRKDFGDRDSRPSRDFGDKPFKKRSFGDRDRSEGRKDFGDKPFKKREFDGDKPRRSFGDKKFGGEGRGKFGDKKFGDRPFKKREFSDKPRRDFDDKPRKDFGGPRSDEGRRDFGDKPFKKRDRDDGYIERKYGGPPQKSFERYGEERVSKKDLGARLKSDRPSYGSPSSAYLYGIHAVTQALLNPKRVHQRLLCTEKGYESLQETWAEALNDNIALPEVTYVEKEDLERLLPRDAVHQDVLLDSQPLEEVFLADVLTNAPENAKIIVLDQVTDPHNVGAILRSASAFGAIGVVMQKLHAPETTGTLAKSASGAVEHVPLIREVNLSRALEQLKEAGFFCIGLDEEGKQPLAKLNLTGKTALVLGAEGSGLRRLVSENCDELVKLPTQGPIASLNVSNAAAVALYELVRAQG